MKTNTSSWSLEADRLKFSVPFQKVDIENRRVTGFATLDNIDRQNDKVDADASYRAFSDFRGNIREMHQPIAVGKLVDFKKDSFYDHLTKTTYNGVWVEVYVSTGAPTTWEKVLDGTLTGFSIGGVVRDSSVEYNSERESTITTVKDFEMIELSLVDSPANPLCNVLSVIKNNDGVTTDITGMATETNVENIFWCETEKVSRTSKEEKLECINCQTQMQPMGWIEFNNQIEKADAVAKKTEAFLRKEDGGAENMTEKVVTADETSSEEVVLEKAADVSEVEPVVEVVEETPAVVEKSVVLPESTDSDLKDFFSKSIGNIQGVVSDLLAKNAADVDQKIIEMKKDFHDTLTKVTEKNDSIEKKLADILEKYTESTESRLDSLEKSTAMRKSQEPGTTQREIKKSDLWQGSILG